MKIVDKVTAIASPIKLHTSAPTITAKNILTFFFSVPNREEYALVTHKNHEYGYDELNDKVHV